MKTKLLFLTLLMSVFSWGQVQLSEGTPSQTIDFSATIPGVSNGAFTAAGFQPTPTAGQLDSDAWATSGFSEGVLNFGGIRSALPINDHNRGVTTALDPTGGGIYAFTGIPFSVANPCLMIQPSGPDFTPGTITLRIQNNGTVFINQMAVSYNIFYRNNADFSNTFNFSYSSDNNTYTNVNTLDFATPQALDALGWLQESSTPSRSITINSLSIAPGQYFYIRWSSNENGGSGARDELGLDDISLTATFGLPSPPIINSDLTSSGFLGVPYSYSIVASNSPTSYNATGLPAGFSINTSTGVITGTPGATGTFFITITATNPGGFDEQTLILTITDPGPEINIRGATGGTNNIINGSIIPNPLNNTLFNSLAIGANQDKDFRIENVGISNLTLTGTPRVVITGLNAGDFTVMTQPVATISSGANSIFVIRFSPLGGGIRTALVSIINNDSDENPYTFTIQGTGIAPNLNVFGNGIEIINGSLTTAISNHTDFGNVNEAGTISKDRNFYIVNYGGADLNLLPIIISGSNASDFTVFANPVSPVTTNNVSILTIRFDPSALGLRQATITIPNNVVGKNPFTFTISGVGINFDECQLTSSSSIFVQNFDTANSLTYTTSTFSTGNLPVITGGMAFGSSRTVSSNKFIGTNSLQVNGAFTGSNNANNGYTSIIFNPVDVTPYSDVELRFNIGAYSTSSTQGLDFGSDQIRVFISSDGGTSWSNELIIKGDDNSIWDINTATPPAFISNFRGINIPLQTSPTTNSVNLGIKEYRLTSLPVSNQLRIKFEFYVDRSDEVWVLDNILIRGRLPLSSTFLNATSTWSPGPPTSTTRAIFAGNFNTALHGNVTACECLINSSRTVTVTPGGYLEIGGRITNNGTLNVQNGGSIIQKDDYAVNAGNNVTVSKATVIKRLDYVYWSSPVENFPLLSVSPGTSASLHFKWNPTVAGNFGTWQVANENMERGKGYIIRAPNAYTNTPAPFSTNFVGRLHNGFIPVDISRGNYTGGGYPSPTNPAITVTADDDNFNLIGNPYPSAISALDFLTDNTNIEGSVRLWTHGLDPSLLQNDPFYGNFAYNYDPNDYIVYNGTMTVSGPSGFAGYIASGQSFFVLMNDGPQTTEQVIFKNSLRNASYDNSQFFKPAPAKQSIEGTSDFKIWLDIVSSSGKAVRTGVGYVDGATNDKDRLYDASTKLDGTTKLYSLINNKPFVIQGRSLPHSLEDQVELGFFAAQAGMYSIAIGALQPNNSSVPVFLEDKLLGITHNLKESPYQFTAAIGVSDDRFVLKFANETLSVNPVSSLDNDVKVISAENGVLKIKSFQENIEQVQLFDLLGRNVLNKNAIQQQELELNLSITKQTVLIKIELANGQLITQKVLLK